MSAIAASETGSISQAGMAVQEDRLLQALADTLDTSSSSRDKQVRRLSSRKRYVDRAREYIEEQLNEPISITRVAEHISVTPRTLEFAFQEVLGGAPLHYLRSRRLNRVRWLLINNGGKHRTIARLAYENGFCQLGNFTRDYKTLFGELPSQTLKNRKEI